MKHMGGFINTMDLWKERLGLNLLKKKLEQSHFIIDSSKIFYKYLMINNLSVGLIIFCNSFSYYGCIILFLMSSHTQSPHSSDIGTWHPQWPHCNICLINLRFSVPKKSWYSHSRHSYTDISLLQGLWTLMLSHRILLQGRIHSTIHNGNLLF